jgi:DNA-binding FadR family transcriptional regulator
LVCRASHNNRLLLSLTALLDHVRQDQFSTLYVGGRPAEAIKEHQTLLMAIETHDAEGAERAAREHRRKTLELRKDMRREQLRKIRSEGEKPSEPQSRAD